MDLDSVSNDEHDLNILCTERILSCERPCVWQQFCLPTREQGIQTTFCPNPNEIMPLYRGQLVTSSPEHVSVI